MQHLEQIVPQGQLQYKLTGLRYDSEQTWFILHLLKYSCDGADVCG